MSGRTYPHGVPCWVDTGQPDVEAAIEFYGGLFGWTFEDAMPPDAAARYAVAKLDGQDVAAIAGPPTGGHAARRAARLGSERVEPRRTSGTRAR